jgi:DNA polymerase-3 subunit alpha
MTLDFVHLHVHSQYSFLTSTVRLNELPRAVKQMSMSAVALTDRANMFGAIRHYKTCRNEGILPIIGCEINVLRDESSGAFSHMVVIAKNLDGYRNLIRLVSMGHLESASADDAVVTLDTLRQILSGTYRADGLLGRARRAKNASERS